MTFLAIIGGLAILYGLHLWFRFTNFRSRLFRTFEHYGVPRQIADHIYTIHNATINDLHINHDLPPELIAIKILEEYGRDSL